MTNKNKTCYSKIDKTNNTSAVFAVAAAVVAVSIFPAGLSIRYKRKYAGISASGFFGVLASSCSHGSAGMQNTAVDTLVCKMIEKILDNEYYLVIP